MSHALGYALHEDGRYLSCHANLRADMAPHPNFDSIKEYGVTCESCHGPSSEWEDPHKTLAWRGKRPQEKEALGMVDVRDPVRRAQQCFSCHIGNEPQGKLITHEMYAVGHPLLPPIELVSFTERMPPHWRNLREKGDFLLRKEFLAANYPAWDASEALRDIPRSRRVVLGSIMTLRETINLMSEVAASDEYNWPELGVFDCGACHHDLRTVSHRQDRGYRGFAPGRIPLPAWPQPLVKVAIGQGAVSRDKLAIEQLQQKFQQRLDGLNQVLAESPLGQRDRVAETGQELVRLLDGVARVVAGRPFNRAAAETMLIELGKFQRAAYLDFPSARQLV